MVSVSSSASDRPPAQPQQHASTSYDTQGRMSANRQGSLSSGPYGSSRLQGTWEPAQGFSPQGPQQMNTGFMPGSQPVWPPGSLPYMQPQVFMYPGLPGNPAGFYPQPLHGAQRPLSQMMPQVGMMVPPQQYSGVTPMFPFAPSPTPEQWLHARNLRPPGAMFQGIRPMGWGGVPFQPPNDPRWQSAAKAVAPSLPPQRPTRPSSQQQPPPPPRAAPFPQLAHVDRHASHASVRPGMSEPQQANRSSSTSAIPLTAVQTEKHKQAPPGVDPVEPARPALGKVPCAFFLKTGTCAYGDK